MKTFSKIFSTLLLVLFTAQVSQVSAAPSPQTKLPVYQDVIADISLSYDKDLLKGSITLASGLIMQITDYKTRDDNVMSKWRAGNVVKFSAHEKHDVLVLSVKRIDPPKSKDVQAEPYVVFDLVNSPKKSGLFILEINEGGKFVKLSDHSVWDFSWYNQYSTRYWKIGERVLVSGSGEKNAYEFINLDVPVGKNASSANATFVAH